MTGRGSTKHDFSYYQADADPIFNELNLLKLMDIIKTKDVLFVHEVLNKNAPKRCENFRRP